MEKMIFQTPNNSEKTTSSTIPILAH